MGRPLLALLTAALLPALSCAVAPPQAPSGIPAAEAPLRLAGDPPSPQELAIRGQLERRRTGLDASEVAELARAVIEASQSHGVDPALVMAVMHVESRFHTYALSPVGALGLMQILPSTGEELAHRYGIDWRGPQTLFDPVTNVWLGVAYLAELTQRYGDVATALAAYNWGPGHIDGRLRRGRALPTVYPGLVFEAHVAQRSARRG